MGPDSIDRERRAFLFGLLGAPLLGRSLLAVEERRVPVLAYHRFGPTFADSMTVRTSTFDAQLTTLERLRCRVITLADYVAWRRGTRTTPLPPRAVILTADDGHRSQYEVMAPMLGARGWPVTLFVYPSAISNATYAMTWAQLKELSDTTDFSVQSHTFWHPNLIDERKRLSPAAFTPFAADQLTRSRDVLQQRLSRPVSRLAWPFGLSDDGLRAQAAECGYEAAVSLGYRSARSTDSLFALPRHLINDTIDARQLEARLTAAFAGAL
jgi:peptidoglycan/xylan/chitin deacetylase (PgdA/CDA1 family)